jgi:hypothetical protein
MFLAALQLNFESWGWFLTALSFFPIALLLFPKNIQKNKCEGQRPELLVFRNTG